VLQLSGTADGRTYRAPSARPATAAQAAAFGVLVDTVPPSLTATSASRSLISPNGDGVKDAVKLALSARGATHWTIEIARAGAAAVRTVSGTGPSGSYTWNGTTDAGAKVADGAWQATLTALDNAGNGARRTYPITVDTTPPAVTPAAAPARLSPDGDGATDRTRLSFTSGERVSGTARIWRGTTLVRSWAVTSVSSWAATWDGRNASGTRVADGRYTFKVAVRDAGGNRTRVSTPVVVDRTASYLRWSGSFFPQDGDRLRPKAALSWKLAREATTTLRVLDAGGSVVRTVWTGRVQAAGSRSWTWDGRLADGTYVPQGRYVAELVATSSLGTTVLRRPVWAAGFAATLSATTVRPGQKLSVAFRTVEPLSSRPRVTLTQPGRSGVTVIATRLADGSYRAVFTVQSGGAGAGSVTISAKDSGGRRNVTTLAIRIGS
jgi:flagellar hook assembly protein FlgD